MLNKLTACTMHCYHRQMSKHNANMMCSLRQCCNTSIWILTVEAGSNLGFFLSLDDDLFFFFFLEEWSLDFVLSGFIDGLLAKLGDSCLLVTFSWLLPTLRTSLIGFSPLSAFSGLSGFSDKQGVDLLRLFIVCQFAGRSTSARLKFRDQFQTYQNNIAIPSATSVPFLWCFLLLCFFPMVLQHQIHS